VAWIPFFIALPLKVAALSAESIVPGGVYATELMDLDILLAVILEQLE
jgi:hypothetical protein